jgi:integrase
MIKKEWLLDFAYPMLGSKRVSEIRPVDVLKVVQEIEFKGNYETARRSALMALLFLRPGELRFAEWTEFDFDKSIWTIPAEKTKLRRESPASTTEPTANLSVNSRP